MALRVNSNSSVVGPALAQMLHARSARARGPFVEINAAGLRKVALVSTQGGET